MEFKQSQQSQDEEELSFLARKIVKTGDGMNYLRNCVENASASRRAAAYFALSESGSLTHSDREGILRRFLGSDDRGLNVVAFYSSINHSVDLSPELIIKHESSDDPWVSAWAHVYSAKFQSSQESTRLRDFLKSDNSWLRQISCDRLGEVISSLDPDSLEFRQAVEDIKSLLSDSDPDVVEVARSGLALLAVNE